MIKKQKNKLLTLLIAGAIGTATLGGVAMANGVTVDAAETYSTSTIFSTTSASLKKDGDGETGALRLEIKDAGKVSYTRDLALKWYEDTGSIVEAKYMSIDFTLANTDFEKLTFAFETESLTATKDGKAIHEVVFTNDGTAVKVKVGNGVETVVADATKKFTLQLSEGATSEEFSANLFQDLSVVVASGNFTNIGANFAEYDTSNDMYSFVVKVEADDEKTANVLLHTINGQSLDLNKDNKFTDDKAPVLVVNEDIDGFVLGTAFALDYEVIDVFDRTVTKTLKYYQYDPDEAKAAQKAYDESTAQDKKVEAPEYKSLLTTTYFHETNYTTSDEKLTSVYKATGGTEYVSIQFTLTDDGKTEGVYYLDWYLGDKAKQVPTTFDRVEGYTTIGYVGVYDNNEEGAKYTCVENEGATDGTEAVNTGNVAYTEFVEALKEIEEEGLSAGEGSYLYLPSMKYLITDNGGYSNLKFTISYKSTSNNSAKTSSSLSSSALKLEVTQAGVYEFKVFAVDKAGNNMKYYDSEKEEIVDVTSSNVWDIDAIPSFSVKVANKGITVEEGTSKRDTEVIYGNYDLTSFGVIGPASATSEYKLFYVDQSKVSGITTSKLTGITYETLADTAKDLKSDASVTERGLDLYKLAYATELKGAIGGEVTVEQILSALVEIEEYNDNINEEDHPDDWENSDNAYKWDSSAQSFTPQKMGNYLIIACFTDPDIAAYDAGAYKLITVQSEEDVLYGEDNWLQNNMASVILFGIAGLMLILIIILLVVKPSDETLEDIDEANKKEKKAKKEKKIDEKVLDELDVDNK